MGPKPMYTLWPYGQAGDSAGIDQRVDRLGHDDQTLYTRNIEAADVGTKYGSYIRQLQQTVECHGPVVPWQHGYHFEHWGSHQRNSD